MDTSTQEMYAKTQRKRCIADEKGNLPSSTPHTYTSVPDFTGLPTCDQRVVEHRHLDSWWVLLVMLNSMRPL